MGSRLPGQATPHVVTIRMGSLHGEKQKLYSVTLTSLPLDDQQTRRRLCWKCVIGLEFDSGIRRAKNNEINWPLLTQNTLSGEGHLVTSLPEFLA